MDAGGSAGVGAGVGADMSAAIGAGVGAGAVAMLQGQVQAPMVGGRLCAGAGMDRAGGSCCDREESRILSRCEKDGLERHCPDAFSFSMLLNHSSAGRLSLFIWPRSRGACRDASRSPGIFGRWNDVVLFDRAGSTSDAIPE